MYCHGISTLMLAEVIGMSADPALAEKSREALARAVRLILDVTGVSEPSPLLLLTLRCWTAVVEGTLLSLLQERTVPREGLDEWLVVQLVAMVGATAAHDPAVAHLSRVVRVQQDQNSHDPPRRTA